MNKAIKKKIKKIRNQTAPSRNKHHTDPPIHENKQTTSPPRIAFPPRFSLATSREKKAKKKKPSTARKTPRALAVKIPPARRKLTLADGNKRANRHRRRANLRNKQQANTVASNRRASYRRGRDTMYFYGAPEPPAAAEARSVVDDCRAAASAG